MVEWITKINGMVNGIVWGPIGLALLFCTGLWMTLRTGGFQFRRVGHWMRHTIGAVFTNKEVTAHTSKEDMAISQFQSMCTALAGTIGTGNIVGVATAIVSGGPGAIFWMWVMAILGMMTSFSENVLGVYYRRKNEKGEWSGGAMYYLTDGLGAKKGCKTLGKVLAVLFACFCILASFGIGNMSQINSIAGNMNAAFHTPYLVTGVALMVVTALIVLGGLKRVAAVTEKLVPLMALFYIVGAVVIVVLHAGNIPAAFRAIFRGAFNLQAAGGGTLGYGISQSLTWGFKRGAFSNEAGLGSAVMVNSSANVKEPVQQGMWGVFEIFADTIVVCTITALVILTTGVVDIESGSVLAGVQDNALVGQAFTAAFGSFGPKFIAISLLFFAYSTVLGWSHYGTKAVEYLFGQKGTRVYKVIFVGMVVVGATMKLGLAWDLLRYVQRPYDDPKPPRGAGTLRHGGADHEKLSRPQGEWERYPAHVVGFCRVPESRGGGSCRGSQAGAGSGSTGRAGDSGRPCSQRIKNSKIKGVCHERTPFCGISVSFWGLRALGAGQALPHCARPPGRCQKPSGG